MTKQKLSVLFHQCAFDVDYQTVGHDVNYAFVEDGDHLLIFFQGSSSVTDWFRNFLFPKKPYKDMKVPYRVHRGFLEAWKEVKDTVISKVTQRFKDEYRWKSVTVVGYSHGGALASLCHECVWFWRPDLREHGLEGFGFESPRFYGGFFVKRELKERWRTFWVVRDGTDIVTHCPPWILGFCHVGRIIDIEGDPTLVDKFLPRFVKYHYPQVVYDGLVKEEAFIGA